MSVVYSQTDCSETAGTTHSEFGCPNIPSSARISKQSNDDHQYPADPFVAPAHFNVILEKARKRTVHEFPRKTPSSLGAKLLIASPALRAFRNRHLGTLMHCCEVWEPVETCLTNAPSSASTSMDSSRLLRASHEKEFVATHAERVLSAPPDIEREHGIVCHSCKQQCSVWQLRWSRGDHVEGAAGSAGPPISNQIKECEEFLARAEKRLVLHDQHRTKLVSDLEDGRNDCSICAPLCRRRALSVLQAPADWCAQIRSLQQMVNQLQEEH